MSRFQRILVCVAILSSGLVAQAGLERLNETERPPVAKPLACDTFGTGRLGRSERERSIRNIVDALQTTEYLSRVYESPKHPGLSLHLWINYSC